MHTIKQVVERTGVKDVTLRAWERRYGLVTPVRSETSGYRLYSDDDIARIRRMHALVASGVPAHLAADSVRTGAPMNPATPGDLLEAALSLDPNTLGSVLDRAFASGAPEQVVDGWLVDELTLVGRAWERGEVGVAQEHFASSGIMRRLAAIFDGGRPAQGPALLIGLPPGDRHELLTFALAAVLRSRGANVVYLGPDVPVVDWVDAVRVRRPWAVCIAAHEINVEQARVVVAEIQALRIDISVFVGGGAAAQIEAAVHLPDSIGDAAQFVESMAGERASRNEQRKDSSGQQTTDVT